MSGTEAETKYTFLIMSQTHLSDQRTWGKGSMQARQLGGGNYNEKFFSLPHLCQGQALIMEQWW